MKTFAFSISLFFLSWFLLGQDLYSVEFHFKTEIKKGKVLFIPYRAYYELKGEVVFERSREGNGYKFTYAYLPSPPWLIVTVGYRAKEVHCRTAWFSTWEGFFYGRKILKEWAFENPYFSKRVKKERIKSLPFLLHPISKDDFYFYKNSFHTTEKGKTYNSIFPVYAWPSRVPLFMNFFQILALVLDEITSIPFSELSRLDFSPFFNELGPSFHPIVKYLVRFRQRKPLYFRQKVYLTRGVKIITGKTFPEVKIWGSYLIKEFERELFLLGGDLLEEDYYMKVSNEKGDGGFAVLRIKKLEVKHEKRVQRNRN